MQEQTEWSEMYYELRRKVLREIQNIQGLVLERAPYIEIHANISNALDEIMLSDSEPDDTKSS
jgi:hypothetical protein